MNLPSVGSANVKERTVLLRADIDVPLMSRHEASQTIQSITDDSRLEASWPTIECLLQQKAKVILCGHVDRPQGQNVPELSTKIIASWYRGKICQFSDCYLSAFDGVKEEKLGNFTGYRVADNLVILENLRFDSQEESNDPVFAKELADLAQVYVNDAFGACEREHASIVGVSKLLPHFAGLRLLQEINALETILEIPRRPLIVIIGGAKSETKIPAISKISSIADRVIVGGSLLKDIKEKLPHVLYLDLSPDTKDTKVASVDQCQLIISYAATIIWNGPLGAIEDITYQTGTRRLAEMIAANTRAFKVVGGGDTVGFLQKLGLISKFDWVSSGGGSMLKFLSGEKLPGLEVLQ